MFGNPTSNQRQHQEYMAEIIKDLAATDCPAGGHKMGFSTEAVGCTDELHLELERFSTGIAEKLELARCTRCGYVTVYIWQVEDGLCLPCRDLAAPKPKRKRGGRGGSV